MQPFLALPTTFRLRRWIASILVTLLLVGNAVHVHADAAATTASETAVWIHASDEGSDTDSTDPSLAHPSCHNICGSALWPPATPGLVAFVPTEAGYPQPAIDDLRSALRQQLKRPPRA